MNVVSAPYFPVPPFPEYNALHAGFEKAMAEVKRGSDRIALMEGEHDPRD